MTPRLFGIAGVGCLVSAGVVWSASVYQLPLFAAVLLSFIPWALAVPALGLVSRESPELQLDLSRAVLQGGLRTKHFSAGDCVIRQGDQAENFYIITSGRARVVIDDEEECGTQTEVAQLVTGQFFGEVGLLNNGVRTASVEALEELDVLVMDKSAFADLVSHSATASDQFRSFGDRYVGSGQKANN